MKTGKSVKSAAIGLIEKLNLVVDKKISKIVKCKEPFFFMEYDQQNGYFLMYRISFFDYIFNIRKSVSIQTKFSFKCLVWVHKEIFLMYNHTAENLVKEVITKNNWEYQFNQLANFNNK